MQEARHSDGHAVRELGAERRMGIEGEGDWNKVSGTARTFFAWLETKSYKCTCACCCHGTARIRPVRHATRAAEDRRTLWRLGTVSSLICARIRSSLKRAAFSGATRRECASRPHDPRRDAASGRAGSRFFSRLNCPAAGPEATDLLLSEIRGRFGYLAKCRIGVPDTGPPISHAAGGEVQRII